MLCTRPYKPSDREFVFSLASRLAIGKKPWRERERWLKTVNSWLTESINQHNHKSMVFIAEDDHGNQLGFATVSHSKHFTGKGQANIGELATSEKAEGRGVGKALVKACENWSKDQGYAILTVSTGAANSRALGLYDNLGFQTEDITLTKIL